MFLETQKNLHEFMRQRNSQYPRSGTTRFECKVEFREDLAFLDMYHGIEDLEIKRRIAAVREKIYGYNGI